MDQDKKLPKTTRVFRKEFIINKIKNLKVMHIGCTGGLLDEDSIKQYKKNFIKEDDTHYQFTKYAKEISGLDISQNKIEFYKNNNMPGKYYLSDITSKDFLHEDTYDVVIFANIIEHLDNVAQSLQNIKKMLNQNGQLIITTNNAFDIKGFLKMFMNYESVHKEHTAYYSYSTLKRVLEMNGYYITEFHFAENEGRKSETFINFIGDRFGRIFSFIFKQFSQDLVLIAKAKK